MSSQRFATVAKCLAIVLVAVLGSFWAGRSGATCYTGCAKPQYIWDTGYSITIFLDGDVPVILDTDLDSVTALCTGGTSTDYKEYTSSGSTAYRCSAGPSAYKGTTWMGSVGGSFPVSKCGTSCT